MSFKKFEQDYINFVDSSIPDSEKLWERIANSSEPDNDTDITPFVPAADQCRKSHKIGHYRIFAAVAAVFIAVIGLRLVTSFDISISDSEYGLAEETRSYEYENFADEAENTSAAVWVSPETGWNYSDFLTENESYLTLNLADTDSGIYNALSGAPAENEYFVEAEVLENTELFIDGTVISSKQVSGCVMYSLEVIRFISDRDMAVPEIVEVCSSSPYALRNNREYLLPVREERGVYTVVFDNAPQIEITRDREIVYHNGWQSLSKNCFAIDYPKVYADDYFYDRMNITAESSLQDLFYTWERLKA